LSIFANETSHNFMKLTAIDRGRNLPICTILLWGISWISISLIATTPVQASCYGWKVGGRATIKLQDKKSGYLRLWSNKQLNRRVVAKLNHGTKIRIINFIEDPVCGGVAYLEANLNDRQVRGWVNGDVLVGYTADE
jgi:hypothetical protein